MITKRFTQNGPVLAAGGLAFTVALLLLGVSTLMALPAGQQVVNGQAAFNTQGGNLTITNSPNAIINWQAFSINANEAVRFVQQSSASAVLNRVVGQDPSRILGLLQSNGTVFLINPNGILFGPGARVDVNGLFASTLNISNQDFLAGKYNFTAGAPAGTIENQGIISTPEGGKVYLIAPNIENSGVIHSPKGEVILAAGQSVWMVDSLDPDIAVVVSAPEDRALNLGQILAQSGRIGIYGGLIVQKGVVSADSAIVGENGRIVFKATQGITLDAGSVTSANGADGGQIEIQSDVGTTLLSGTVTATGAQGRGGDVKILGDQVGLIDNALIDASGKTGGGTVLIGGDYQGKNPGIKNAEATFVGPGARIRADATETGDGGKVIVWADDTTRFYGTISARGGQSGGDGGFVETSGKKYLAATGMVDAGAPKGKSGLWFLDPNDIEIRATADVNITSSPNFTTVYDTAVLTPATIQGVLNGGTDVTITTGTGPANTQQGNITVTDGITWTTGKTLTLNAHNSIFVNAALANNGGGSLVLRADSDSAGGGNVVFAGAGHVTLTGGGMAKIFYNPPAGYATPTYYPGYFTGVVPSAYMLVNNVTDLQNIASNLAGTYALGTNIDASITSTWGSGNFKGFNPLGDNSLIPAQSFTGFFDGFGHIITGLYIYRPTTDYVGLFGGTIGGPGNIIQNVGLLNVNITGHFQVAGLVAHTGASVINSYVNGGTVTGTSNTVGGLVALNAGTISNCYSTANVSGGDYVGGLIGANYGAASSVSNSYSTGTVTAGQKGGLSGYNAGSVTGSYWDTQTSGLLTSYGGTGELTADMKLQTTFVGWDFVNTWTIVTPGTTYPSIIGLSSLAPPAPTPPAPNGSSSSTVPAATVSAGNGVAVGNTEVALMAATEPFTTREENTAEPDEEKTREGKEGEQKTDEKQGVDKRTNFCN